MSPGHTYRPPCGSQPSKPRLSASLIVINSKNEVLLVCRTPGEVIYAGAHVFPGGNYDSRHDGTLRDTAVRETFEETGLLLATFSSSSVVPTSSDFPPDQELNHGREAIHSHRIAFKDFLGKWNLKVDETSLLPFSQWVTPPNYPRRFQAQFYLILLEDPHSACGPSSGFSSRKEQQRLPAHDGGKEIVEARFVHPRTAIREFREKKISLPVPQFYLISTLSEILTTSEMTSEQRAKILELSGGLFGKSCFHPLELATEDVNKTVFTYEGDDSRGGKPGCLHRSTVKLNKTKTLTIEEVVERNFDIFTELDARWWTHPKL